MLHFNVERRIFKNICTNKPYKVSIKLFNALLYLCTYNLLYNCIEKLIISEDGQY